MNPYSAPYAPAPALPLVMTGGWLKWAHLACVVAPLLLTLVGALADAALSDPNSPVPGLFIFLGVLLYFLRLVFALVWVYVSWNTLPPQWRRTRPGRLVSPGEAVGYLFIPFYNLYWMFVASAGLCEAMDIALESSGSTRRAPKGLAIASCVTQIIPYCNLLVAPILWTIFMFLADSARAEVVARLKDAPAPPPWGPAYGAAPVPLPYGGFR